MASTSTPPRQLRIATRASRLALWQAEHVADRLRRLVPGCSVELVTLTTTGDRILDRPLAEIGGKGLFTKELELALLDGRAELAVHSLKDVPMDLPDPFGLAAVLEREDPRDAFVSVRHASLDALPDGAVVGTSSLRRSIQLRDAFPHLRIESLRGNLDTRLGKLDAGQYDAIILAAAGLIRLGAGERIRQRLPVDSMLPSPGQGAIAIEYRLDRADLLPWLALLDHAETARAVAAERMLSRRLGGNCRMPLAAFAAFETVDASGAAVGPGQAGTSTAAGGHRLRLRALLADDDGVIHRREATNDVVDVAGAERLGSIVADALVTRAGPVSGQSLAQVQASTPGVA